MHETIFDELVRIAESSSGARVEQHTNQPDGEFMLVLLKHVGKSSDELFNSMSIKAQEWYTMAVKLINGRKPFPNPEGYRSGIREEAATLPSTRPVLEKKPAAPKPPKIKQEGVVDAIRKTIILNPDWTTRRVHQYITANGWPAAKLDVVAVNAGDIRKTIAKARELGFWREEQYNTQKAI